MKVHFAQSGGVLGLVKGCELDTATLAPEAARALEQLVRTSGISASGQFFSDAARDLQQYEVTIEDGGSKISVAFDDQNIPQAAKPLLGYLKRCARPMPLT